jgi:DNA-binding NarL/FixJ family response regulator
MNYKNGTEIFPQELIAEIQKYISGGLVYIPQIENKRKEWGELSGFKTEIRTRNSEIREKFSEGLTIDELAAKYCLSVETIKKIVYKKQLEAVREK